MNGDSKREDKARSNYSSTSSQMKGVLDMMGISSLHGFNE